MAQSTRATRALEQAGITFDLYAYDYDPSADSIGLAAAKALEADRAQVFKTLMVLADAKPACIIAPSSGDASMKKAAAAFGAKAAVMMKPADAERLTGYRIGGISPFGQMRRVAMVIDETAVFGVRSSSTADSEACKFGSPVRTPWTFWAQR